MQDYSAKVVNKIFLNASTVELVLELIKPKFLRFTAGQFMFFNFGGAYKAYSMVSLPAELPVMRFCIRLVPKGKASEKIKSLELGDVLDLAGPEGNFKFRHFRRNVCFVAGGVGITPFVPMVENILVKGFTPTLTLMHFVKKEDVRLYDKLFVDFSRKFKNFKYIRHLESKERQEKFFSEKSKEYKDNAFYVCGSRKFVENCSQILEAWGCPSELVIQENFF